MEINIPKGKEALDPYEKNCLISCDKNLTRKIMMFS